MKSPYGREDQLYSGSRPVRGAWIEILKIIRARAYEDVAPRKGRVD